MDELIISSTTDTAEQMQAALAHGTKPPSEEVLSTVGEEDEKPADDTAKKDDDAPPDEKKPEGDEKTPVEKKVKASDEKKPDVDDEDDVSARVKKRISRLVAEREDQRRRADDAEARVAAAEAKKTKAEEKPADEKVAHDAEWLKTNPEPKQDDFEDYDAYSKKWVAWESDRREQISIRKAEEAGRAAADEVLKKRADQEQADRETADRTEQFQRFEESREEARSRYDDFDDVIAEAKDLKLTPEMQFVIMDSPVGHDISYWLATHKDEAADLAALSGAEATRELGRLERTIELQVESHGRGEKTRTEREDPPKQKRSAVTKAPAPIAPVGGRSVATAVDLADPNLSYSDYKLLRDKQDLAKRRHRR